MNVVQIQPFRGAHLQRVTALLREVLHADPSAADQFVSRVLLDANFRPEGAVVAQDGVRVLGFALGIVRRVPLEDGGPDSGACYLTLLAVKPTARRQGLGTTLLQHIERFAKSHGADRILVSPYAPNYFAPGVDLAAYPDALRLLTRLGYEVVHRPVSMERSLTQYHAPQWLEKQASGLHKAGVRVEPYRPEWTLAVLEFLRAEFPGDWQRCAREAMTEISGGAKPTRLWLALQQSQVLGFSHHHGERLGPIGVARKVRGRGIGQVLLWRTLETMRASGLRLAWFLWSDDATASRFYLPAGFEVTRRFAVFRKRLE